MSHMVTSQLHAHDNQDFYPPNPDDRNTMDGYNRCPGTVTGGNGAAPPGPDTFNPTLLLNEKKCLVAPYVKNITIFKCPADQRTGPYSGNVPALAGRIVPASPRCPEMVQVVRTLRGNLRAWAREMRWGQEDRRQENRPKSHLPVFSFPVCLSVSVAPSG
jgi:hypothetical protein